MKRIGCLMAAFLLLSAFTSQPLDERKTQDSLPKSQNKMWQTLGNTEVSADSQGYYSAKIPGEIKALEGKEVTIDGFMLPLESTEKFKHFILSKRTPTCPFCPPGAPNEIIDVWTQEPIAYSEEMIKVKGTFGLMSDREMGMFFKLTNAKKL